MMQMVHELPGTTFSNPAQRGDYDSAATACLTMTELQRWLAMAVASYHGQVHGTTWQTPAAHWASGVTAMSAAGRMPVTVTNATAFLVDFLPVVRRTLTRTGFVIDHVHYFGDGLKPWIACRDRLDRFVIRRDPRDISRVWVLDLDGQFYLEVPYRTLSHPPISVWEHKAALARLRAEGRAQVDEDALFRMVEQMHAITDAAATTTRRARRDAARRAAVPPRPPAEPVCVPPDEAGDEADEPAAPFDVIEQW
jgi:putative transposase